MLVTLMTDASVCGSTGAGGYGFWVVSPRGGVAGQGTFNTTIKDSFEGELKAVANALHQSISMNKIQTGDKVIIQLDNSGVVNCLNKVNKVRDDMTHVMDYISKLLLTYKLVLDVRHVKGHSSRKESRYVANKLCDLRAKEEMRKRREEILNAKN